jgi:Phage terminase-like protein, large subunit
MEFYSKMVEDEGDVIRRYQYLYLEIPKKNGKTELSAALGLYHLFADGERKAEVYLCAADRDNAGIIYDAMEARPRHSESLCSIWG